jgi:hypothetical protein
MFANQTNGSSAASSLPPNNNVPNSVRSVDLKEFSYQNAPETSEDYGLSESFLGDVPNSGISKPTTVDPHLPHMRGDATIRPNTGNSNQNAGDPLGSLQEITSYLRWITIVSTCAAIVWEGFAFPLRLIGQFLYDPSQVVLGAYLGFFCLLLLGGEFNHPDLKDNFGFLYYPLSRGITLLMMCTMCLGILNKWWESLLGLNFGIVGAGYIYAYIRYPEYRRWQHYNERMPTAWQEATMYWTGDSVIPTASWASPQKPDFMSPKARQAAASVVASETESLLKNVVSV